MTIHLSNSCLITFEMFAQETRKRRLSTRLRGIESFKYPELRKSMDWSTFPSPSTGLFLVAFFVVVPVIKPTRFFNLSANKDGPAARRNPPHDAMNIPRASRGPVVHVYHSSRGASYYARLLLSMAPLDVILRAATHSMTGTRCDSFSAAATPLLTRISMGTTLPLALHFEIEKRDRPRRTR